MVIVMVEDAVVEERPRNMRKRSLMVRYVGAGEHALKHVGEDRGEGDGDGEHADEHTDEDRGKDADEEEDEDDRWPCTRFWHSSRRY